MAAQARHTYRGDPRARQTRIATLAVVWIAGLGAGFFGILAAFAAYGCASSARGLACTTPGTLVAILVVVAVISVVTAVTVITHDREQRWVLAAGVLGLIGLALCFLAARGLLSTV